MQLVSKPLGNRLSKSIITRTKSSRSGERKREKERERERERERCFYKRLIGEAMMPKEKTKTRKRKRSKR